MKQFNPLRFFYVVIGLISIISSNAQVQTARNIAMPGSNSLGFYEYLPRGYNPSGTQTYPLLVFLHGAGEVGNGNSDITLLLRHGPPNMINWNNTIPGFFPDSFFVNGTWHKLIIISPQFLSWPGASNVNAVLNYCILNYKVNINKIYITGLSMGGGAIWDFASNTTFGEKVAAIAPMAGSLAPSIPFAKNIALNKVATWAFNNNQDPVTPVEYTINWVDYINLPPTTPNPPARKTIFNAIGHDCWYLPYHPNNFSEIINGVPLNLYQWMLQFSRPGVTIVLPVTLTEYKATLTGATQVTITWSTSKEENNKHFTLERSTDGINYTTVAVITGTNTNSSHTYTFKDDSPAAGNNFYRLSQTDIDGKVKYFDTLKVTIGTKRQQTFVLNPNPVRDKLVLDLYHEERGLLQVLLQDIHGKTLRNWKFEKSDDQWKQTLNIPELSRGMYLITIVGKTFRESKKLIKE